MCYGSHILSDKITSIYFFIFIHSMKSSEYETLITFISCFLYKICIYLCCNAQALLSNMQQVLVVLVFQYLFKI